MAEVEYRLGDYTSAVEHAHRALARKPEDEEPHRILFAAYEASGKRREASASLEAYVAKHPLGRAGAYRRLATEFYNEGRIDAGRRFLEEAIRAGPTRPEEHALIAVMLAVADDKQSDLLFVGGDFNNQPISAFEQAKPELEK